MRRTAAAALNLLLLPGLAWGTERLHSAVHNCCHGVVVRQALPPYSWEPFVSWVPGNSTHPTGWLADATQWIREETGIDFQFVKDIGQQDFVFGVSAGGDVGNYSLPDHLDVAFLTHGNRITFVSARAIDHVTTGSMYTAEMSVVTLKVARDPNIWQLFEPFSSDLWMATLTCALLTALLMTVVEALHFRRPLSDTQAGAWRQQSKVAWLKKTTVDLACTTYHSFALLLGGEEYEWSSWSGRILRIGALFLALILVATYTANLAAFFTRPAFTVHGPTTMSALKDATVCIAEPFYSGQLVEFTKAIVRPPDTVTNVAERFRMCHEMIKSREADAWLSDLDILQRYKLKDCDASADLEIQSGIRLTGTDISWVLRKEDAALAMQLTAVLGFYRATPHYIALRDKYFGGLNECATGGGDSDTEPVTFESIRGLFYIYLAFAMAGLLSAVASKVLRHGENKITSTETQLEDLKQTAISHNATDGQMLRYVVAAQNQLLECNAALAARSATGGPTKTGSPAGEGTAARFTEVEQLAPLRTAPRPHDATSDA